MHKLLYLIGLLQFTHWLPAQTYKSVLDNSAFVQFTDLNFWYKKSGNLDNDDPYYLGTVKSMDSLVYSGYYNYGGFTYNKYESVYNYSYPDEWEQGAGNVYLRQDIDNIKLYSRGPYSTISDPEKLIYDISLQKGDTFPTQVYYIINDGVGFDEYFLDTNLIVDTVYYVEGRKVVQFSYWQKFGPFSQYYAFIEGIGPNYGIHPLTYYPMGYSFACLLGVYKKSGKRYDFTRGVLPEPIIPPYLSVLNNSVWQHFVVKGDWPIEANGDDPFYTNMLTAIGDIYVAKIDTIDGNLQAQLQTNFDNNTIFITQVSDCSQLYSSIDSPTNSQLIYDISLNKGDPFETQVYTQNDDGSAWNWVDTTLYVDTIFYRGMRKVIQFNYWQKLGPCSHYYQFIEGYGPSFGLAPLGVNSSYTFGRLLNVGDYFYESYVSIPNQSSAHKQINIYPNPVNEYLNIDGISKNSHNYIKIYNVKGGNVFNSPLNINTIDVKHLPEGLYFISVYSKNQIIYSTKFIKL